MKNFSPFLSRSQNFCFKDEFYVCLIRDVVRLHGIRFCLKLYLPNKVTCIIVLTLTARTRIGLQNSCVLRYKLDLIHNVIQKSIQLCICSARHKCNEKTLWCCFQLSCKFSSAHPTQASCTCRVTIDNMCLCCCFLHCP